MSKISPQNIPHNGPSRGGHAVKIETFNAVTVQTIQKHLCKPL